MLHSILIHTWEGESWDCGGRIEFPIPGCRKDWTYYPVAKKSPALENQHQEWREGRIIVSIVLVFSHLHGIFMEWNIWNWNPSVV